MLQLRYDMNHGLIMRNVYDDDQDEYFGYTLKKCISQWAYKAFSNGEEIYEVVYTTDGFRRRIIGLTNIDATKHILLFGDSLTFGEGLSDNETLQYFLQKDMSEYVVYNYAVSGYGPQHMLALLETDKLPQEVKERGGVGIYIYFGPYNMRRLIGSASTPWIYKSPHYMLDTHQQIIRKGSFLSDRSAITQTYSIYWNLLNYSTFLKLINIDLPITMSDKNVLLMYKLIEQTKVLYEKQFNGRFYVFIHPFTYYSREVLEVIQLLKTNHIPVLEYTNDVTSDIYKITGDEHPNGVLNKNISSYFVTELSR